MDSRYLSRLVVDDAFAAGKMAFVSGPRQVGKTTLGKGLLRAPENYFSWDDVRFRRAWVKSPHDALASAREGPVVLDEIHKDRRWKSRLKGYFDTSGSGAGLLVTGSARLDLYRRGGDSMLGRFLPYRLHPWSVAERTTPPGPDALEARPVEVAWESLLALGGFPEPLFAASENKAKRWSRLRIERLVQEDVRDIRAVADLSGLRLLADLLPDRVGSLLSVNALREDLGVSHGTLTAWLEVFEALYFSFFVRPYTRKLARAVAKAPKVYLFDPLQISRANLGARLENLTALHLRKACDYWTDSAQGHFELRYLRNKDQREVDFLILRDREPWFLIECKTSDTQVSSDLVFFQASLRAPHAVQLVQRDGFDRLDRMTGIRIVDYERFFSGWV
ncbi:MAG: ATP-binding protein [Myxococcaceae bacterium]